jgi:hypothetical protein
MVTRRFLPSKVPLRACATPSRAADDRGWVPYIPETVENSACGGAAAVHQSTRYRPYSARRGGVTVRPAPGVRLGTTPRCLEASFRCRLITLPGILHRLRGGSPPPLPGCGPLSLPLLVPQSPDHASPTAKWDGRREEKRIPTVGVCGTVGDHATHGGEKGNSARWVAGGRGRVVAMKHIPYWDKDLGYRHPAFVAPQQRNAIKPPPLRPLRRKCRKAQRRPID